MTRIGIAISYSTLYRGLVRQYEYSILKGEGSVNCRFDGYRDDVSKSEVRTCKFLSDLNPARNQQIIPLVKQDFEVIKYFDCPGGVRECRCKGFRH